MQRKWLAVAKSEWRERSTPQLTSHITPSTRRLCLPLLLDRSSVARCVAYHIRRAEQCIVSCKPSLTVTNTAPRLHSAAPHLPAARRSSPTRTAQLHAPYKRSDCTRQQSAEPSGLDLVPAQSCPSSHCPPPTLAFLHRYAMLPTPTRAPSSRPWTTSNARCDPDKTPMAL